MTTKHDAIIDKIRKLQSLATSPNVHEAAKAAAKAQELIERYRIEAHLLDDAKVKETDEDLFDQVIHIFPGNAVTTWILQLASAICAVQGVKLYYSQGPITRPRDYHCPKCDAYPAEACINKDGYDVSTCHNARFNKAKENDGLHKGTISGVGTAVDLEIAEIMINCLQHEVERFYKEEKPKGLSKGDALRWAKSFRNGAVATIRSRLMKAQRQVWKEMEAEAQKVDEKAGTNYALVRIQKAILHVDARHERAELEAARLHPSLCESAPRSTGSSIDGFIQGRKAGGRADLEGHKRKRLK